MAFSRTDFEPMAGADLDRAIRRCGMRNWLCEPELRGGIQGANRPSNGLVPRFQRWADHQCASRGEEAQEGGSSAYSIRS